METLESAYSQAKGSENYFTNKSILFIGSESYDAPAITVLQGLDKLGFDVYTLWKENINSWFCNTVIDDPSKYDFDFVLSNFHWGTRWSHYERFELDDYPWVLIDGDDNPGLGTTWRDKYEHYRDGVYSVDPPEAIKERNLMPFRWVEPLHGYDPDVRFASQKHVEDEGSHYLPFGIHEQYFQLATNRTVEERTIDLTHIPGPGAKRTRMSWGLKALNSLRLLPGTVHNEEVRGQSIYPDEIADYVESDDNVHSYHRWQLFEEYFSVLNNSQILVYPGVDDYPFWDSKRPWEALVSGCFVLLWRPNIDVSEYPITELSDYAVYGSFREFLRKYRYLNNNPEELEERRTRMVSRAMKYFSPEAIARYFLFTIASEVS